MLTDIQCSKSCGEGTETRAVKCRDHLGEPVPDHRCHPSGRPEYSRTCHSVACPTPRTLPNKSNYRWKTAPWTTVGQRPDSAGIEMTNNPSGPSTASTFNSSTSSSLTTETTPLYPSHPSYRPIYSYFANYYRFDGWPVRNHSGRTSDTTQPAP